ncbi:hypothetical protein QWU01_25325 [Kluyvera cryocrescens]|uniref:Uncharacterized protein n=1 Tax=Kluyvera cryocrescens TaxID=580 RepID=A0AAW9CEV4_KLUCR|nr:hypothetical protein [Kluyvera cryocrescens]MDW3780119.1 hypothetical protein [Kluyvera cryocrescens]
MSYGLVFGHGFNGRYVEGLSIVGEFIYLPGGLVSDKGEHVDNRQFNYVEKKIEIDSRTIIVAYAGEYPSDEDIMDSYEDAKEAYPHHFNVW